MLGIKDSSTNVSHLKQGKSRNQTQFSTKVCILNQTHKMAVNFREDDYVLLNYVFLKYILSLS